MSFDSTKIYQKTRIANTTTATNSGTGALVVEGGASIADNIVVGIGADSLIFRKNDVNTIYRSGIINIVAAGGFGLNLQGSANSILETSAGTLTLSAPTAVNLNSTGSVVIKNNFEFSTGVQNQIFGSGGLTLSTDAGADIILTPGGFAKVYQIPTNPEDIVPKSYVDSVASGLDIHASCRVIAFTLPSYTAAGSQIGKTLTADAPGILTVDTINLVQFDRVLVNLQPNSVDNGIYVVTTEGTAGVPFVLTRAIDADTNAELTTGAFAFIEEGFTYGGSGFVCTTLSIIVDTTPIVFVQFSSAGILVISQIGGGFPVFANNGNNKDFYSISTLVDNDHGAAADALTIELINGNENQFVLDMSKFQNQLTISNQVAGPINIYPFNNLFCVGPGGFVFDTSAATRIIRSSSGDIQISAFTNNLVVGNPLTSTITLATQLTTESTISATAELILSTVTAGITLLPFNTLTTFGVGNTVEINSTSGTITRGNGSLTIANTISGGITLLPFDGDVSFGNVNTVVISTASDPSITGSSVMTLSTITGAIVVNPANNLTEFGLVTPVVVNSATGTITRAGVLTLSTTSGNLQFTPATNVSVFGTSALVTIDTSTTPQISGNTSLTLDTNGGNLIFTPSTNITRFGLGVLFTVNDSTGVISRAGLLTLSTTAGGVAITPFNDTITMGNTTTVSVTTSVSPILTGSTTLTLATTAGNVISNASTGITQFGLVTPVLINGAGTISREANLTISTVTTGNISISPVTGVTNFNSVLTINSLGPNSNITANSGNFSIIGSAGTINLVTNATNYTTISSGGSTIATASTNSGTLRVFGPTANTGGLAVDGTIFATANINAPVFANNEFGNTLDIRVKTADATGAVRIPTTKILYGSNSLVNRYKGTFTKAESYTGGPATVPLFTFVLPNNLNVYLIIDAVVDDGTLVYIHSAKLLIKTSNTGVVSKIDIFEAVTDPKFTYSLGIANTAILNYTQTNAASVANMTVSYYTTGTANVDVTSFA